MSTELFIDYLLHFLVAAAAVPITLYARNYCRSRGHSVTHRAHQLGIWLAGAAFESVATVHVADPHEAGLSAYVTHFGIISVASLITLGCAQVAVRRWMPVTSWGLLTAAEAVLTVQLIG